MTSDKNCYVYIVLPGTTDFVTAARFQLDKTREGVPIGKLVYGKQYLARADAVELDPIELRLGSTQYQTTHLNGFFGAIRDAMPDYWGRRVIEHNIARPLHDFDYLMFGADDRAGALGFGLNVVPPAPRREFSKTLDLEALQAIAEIIISNGSTDGVPIQSDVHQIQTLLLEGTSMGGARPKAVVEDSDNLWIAKFSSPQDRWNQPIIEHGLLTLARYCGLNVAESKITTVAGKDVLLVKRFDRDKQENGYLRYRMVSALTLLKSDEDPVERENWSYLLLADEVRRVSSSAKADLRELFSRMCFNALISNLDDHPRNHAVLARDKHWKLSPAYDLTPTISIAQDARLLAMTCGESGRVASRNNLLTAHGRFLLTEEEAVDIVDTLTSTVKSEWYPILRRVGASEKDCSMLANAFVYRGFFY